MREITVATVQMKPELGNAEANLVKMSDFVSKITSQQKVDLIVFPELITCGYELGVRFTEIAQRVPGPAVNLMAQRAADAGVYIAFGLATKEKVESVLYNSAVLVGPDGELLGTYNKVHLRGEERMAFREGYKMPVIETHEIGKVGLMLGWDLAFPEVARCMTLEGAEMLCVLANWEMPYMDEWKTYVRARAYENALFVAAANRVGDDVTMSFGGESMIVGPRGQVYASLENEMPAPKREPKEQKEPEAKAAPVHVPEAVTVAAAGPQSNGEAKKEEAAAPKSEAAEGAERAEAAKAAETAAEKKPEPSANPPVPTPAGRPGARPDAKPDIRKPVVTEGYCVARINLDEVRRCREEFQTLQARQPIVYRSIVKRY